MDEVIRSASGDVAFLTGRGEMACRIREHDWSATPLGPVEGWPGSLRTMLGFLLRSPVPMVMLWGPDGIMLYNDAYAAFAGGRHPGLLGAPVREGWPEAADFSDNAMRVGLAGGTLSFRDQELTLLRPGRPERAWMNLDYSPVPGDDGMPAGVLCILSETTERVAAERGRVVAEATLHESEARYRQIVEGADDFAIVTLDERGVITGWNSGAERIMGWPREEAIGQPAAIFFTPEDRAAGIPDHEMNRATTDKRVVDERWHLRRDGTRFWGSGLTMRLEGEGFLKMFRDRTIEHEGEAALREGEARFQALVNSIDQMVWSTRPDGFHDFYNQRWYDYTGVPQGSTDGEAWNGLFHPDDQKRAWTVWQHSLETGELYRIEYRLRHHSGQYRWVLGRAQAVRDAAGRITRWFGTCTDIEDIMEAREVLARSREELERRVEERTAERDHMWETSPDLMLVIDFAGVLRRTNPAWTRVLGYAPEELVGHHVNEFVLPDDHGVTVDAYEVAAEGGRPRIENRYRHKDGSLRWISWVAAPAGDVTYATGRDVTAEKAREAELAATQEALRQSQKMDAMGQLTGGVAHDFNNLLTPIIGSLDRLLTRGVGSERERRLMAGALESAERAKTLVQQLLAFARRQPLQPTAVDLPKLVNGMAGLINSTLGPKIDVKVDLAPDLPPARADANQLEMALLNLAVNARDAMPEGGRLTIAAARASVRGTHRSGLKRGHYVRLAVSDTGCGMDEATLARAVEPFFSTKGIGRGTGLGLSMVHGLAAQLGGGLTIESQIGRGTTVELWLPISAEAVGEADASRAAPQPVTSRGRALLVDDEDLVRMSTADMLADLGFDVVEAGSAEEALQVLQEGMTIDLLVTDHLMPGMSGADLARELKALRPELPILIVSGYAEVEGIAPDLPRLTKPFRAAELAERVAALMPGAAVAR